MVKKEDVIFLIPTCSILVLTLLVTLWDYLEVQRTGYHFGLVNAIGLGFVLIGALIRMIAWMTLGRFYSPFLRISKDHRLVKYGIYGVVRHPHYLGDLLGYIGAPMFLSSLYGSLIAIWLVPCFLYRIQIEEKMLFERFGEEYQEYARKTKKLIPFIY